MKRLLVLLIILCPALAIAQAPPPPPPPGGPMGGAGGPPPPGAPGMVPGVGTTWIGGGLELNTSGGFSDSAGMGMTVNGDLTSTLALNGLFEYQVSDVLAIGLAPRYLFGFHASNAQNN